MIVSPIDNNMYSIHSVTGRELLKQYIGNYKNGGSLEEFIKKRGLETNPYEWTAPIPPPAEEYPSIDSSGFNEPYTPRPELSPEIKEELLNASKKWLRKYYKNKRNKRKPEDDVVFNDNLGRGKRKRTPKVLNLAVPPKRARKIITREPKKRALPPLPPSLPPHLSPSLPPANEQLARDFKSLFGDPHRREIMEQQPIVESPDPDSKFLKDHDTAVQPWEIGLVSGTPPIPPQPVEMNFIKGSAAGV